MDLREIMEQKHFVVVGDTLNQSKYAYIIKNQLEEHQYQVSCVGKELSSIDEVEGDIDVIDLCIHPTKGITLLKQMMKPAKCVLIQPGAESAEIFEYLKTKDIPYLEGCVLVGLRLYRK